MGSMPHAIQRINLAGRDLTEWMCKILMDSKITLTTSAEKETAKKMKEELCYVAEDYDAEMADFQDKTKKFEMPDGTSVEVHAQQIRPPERMISVWIGGSILASLSTFSRMWICKESDADATPPITGYDEVGPRIVHQMCSQ